MEKDLKKLSRKNKSLCEQVGKKILQIIENPELGKPLGNVLCGKRRSHVGSFVLIYKVDEAQKKIDFLSLDHHDDAYE